MKKVRISFQAKIIKLFVLLILLFLNLYSLNSYSQTKKENELIDSQSKPFDKTNNKNSLILSFQDTIVPAEYIPDLKVLYRSLLKAFKDSTIDYTQSNEKFDVRFTVTKEKKIIDIQVKALGMTKFDIRYQKIAEKLLLSTENNWKPATKQGKPIDFPCGIFLLLRDNF